MDIDIGVDRRVDERGGCWKKWRGGRGDLRGISGRGNVIVLVEGLEVERGRGWFDSISSLCT